MTLKYTCIYSLLFTRKQTNKPIVSDTFLLH